MPRPSATATTSSRSRTRACPRRRRSTRSSSPCRARRGSRSSRPTTATSSSAATTARTRSFSASRRRRRSRTPTGCATARSTTSSRAMKWSGSSGAGVSVAYCLRITDVVPIEYELIFERFLNPERISMPDIDIDFCYRRRDEVIRYVTEKYGRDNVAQIITFGTMAARAVIRDVGRGLNLPYADVDRIAKLVPAALDATIDKAIAEVPQLREMYEGDGPGRELLEIARRLEGLTRHASTHAAGVVISPKPIVEYAPLYQPGPDALGITTGYAKDEIEEIGLLKMDFLGLRTLTLIDDCARMI